MVDSMTQYRRYNEHPAAALSAMTAHLKRFGATLVGIGGNDSHRYGYHLSAVRLAATGQQDDYSLQGAANRPVADMHAAHAIDIAMDWPAAPAWLEWVRAERHAGRLPQVVELIGATNGENARYAAASTGWTWDRYTGEGHITWCHLSIGRRYAGDEQIADQLFAGWTANGRKDHDVSLTAAQAIQLDNIERMLGAARDGKDSVTLRRGDTGAAVEMSMHNVRDLSAIGWTLGIRAGQVPEHVRDSDEQSAIAKLQASVDELNAQLGQLAQLVERLGSSGV